MANDTTEPRHTSTYAHFRRAFDQYPAGSTTGERYYTARCVLTALADYLDAGDAFQARNAVEVALLQIGGPALDAIPRCDVCGRQVQPAGCQYRDACACP